MSDSTWEVGSGERLEEGVVVVAVVWVFSIPITRISRSRSF